MLFIKYWNTDSVRQGGIWHPTIFMMFAIRKMLEGSQTNVFDTKVGYHVGSHKKQACKQQLEFIYYDS